MPAALGAKPSHRSKGLSQINRGVVDLGRQARVDLSRTGLGVSPTPVRKLINVNPTGGSGIILFVNLPKETTMTKLTSIVILVAFTALASCTDTKHYPVSGDECGPTDPVKEVETLDCVPAGT